MTAVLPALLTAVATIGSAALMKKPKLPSPIRPVTRDDAAVQVSMDDELRRRRGSAADILTGNMGAEAATSQVGKLVVGS